MSIICLFSQTYAYVHFYCLLQPLRYPLIEDLPDPLQLEFERLGHILKTPSTSTSRADVKRKAYCGALDRTTEMRTTTGIYPLLEGHPNNSAIVHYVLKLAVTISEQSEEELPPLGGGIYRATKVH